MIFILAIIFFVFGLIIGSFLNVVILRLNTQKSFGGRSGCMTCPHKLSWHELIPVFSYFWLGGRCRSCKIKISAQYPLVELATGIVFVALFFKFFALAGEDLYFLSSPLFFAAYAYYAVMFSLLVVIAAYDLKHKIIPDALSFIFGLLAFVGLFFFNIAAGGINGPYFYPHIPVILEFLSGIFIAFPFFFFWLVSGGRWMGLGDAKLALGLGWLFGSLGISLALSGLVVAFWSGAIVGVALIILSKTTKMEGLRVRGMKSEIPFAPFLVLGAFLAFIFELNLFGI